MAVSALLASDCVLIAFFELPYPDYSRSRSPTLTDSSLVYALERSLSLTPPVSRTLPPLSLVLSVMFRSRDSVASRDSDHASCRAVVAFATATATVHTAIDARVQRTERLSGGLLSNLSS